MLNRNKILSLPKADSKFLDMTPLSKDDVLSDFLLELKKSCHEQQSLNLTIEDMISNTWKFNQRATLNNLFLLERKLSSSKEGLIFNVSKKYRMDLIVKTIYSLLPHDKKNDYSAIINKFFISDEPGFIIINPDISSDELKSLPTQLQNKFTEWYKESANCYFYEPRTNNNTVDTSIPASMINDYKGRLQPEKFIADISKIDENHDVAQQIFDKLLENGYIIEKDNKFFITNKLKPFDNRVGLDIQIEGTDMEQLKKVKKELEAWLYQCKYKVNWWHHNHPLKVADVSTEAKKQGHHYSFSIWKFGNTNDDNDAINHIETQTLLTSPYGLTLIDPALQEKPSEKYMDKVKMVWSIPYVSEMLKLNFAIRLDAQQQYLLARAISDILLETISTQHKDRNLQQLRQLIVDLKQNIRSGEYYKFDNLLEMDHEQLKKNFQTFNYREINAFKAGYLPIFVTWRTLQKWDLMDKPVEEAVQIIQEKMKTITRDFRRPDETTHLEMLTANPYLLEMLE